MKGGPFVQKFPSLPHHGQLFSGPSWAARCGICGKVISKYAFTSDDAQAELDEHLAKIHGVGVEP